MCDAFRLAGRSRALWRGDSLAHGRRRVCPPRVSWAVSQLRLEGREMPVCFRVCGKNNSGYKRNDTYDDLHDDIDDGRDDDHMGCGWVPHGILI